LLVIKIKYDQEGRSIAYENSETELTEIKELLVTTTTVRVKMCELS